MVAEIGCLVLYLLGLALASDHYPTSIDVPEGETLKPSALWACILLWPAVEFYNLKGDEEDGR